MLRHNLRMFPQSRLEEELEQRFQQALEAEKLEALAEFAAGAGHEINNPLTVISGRAQLLLREEANPDRRHALALISAQAMRIHEMIADMMLFARPPRPDFQTIELVGLVDQLIGDLLPRCSRQETAICRTGQSEPVFVEADPAQLSVALRAVCQNALEAIQSGGNIEITIEREEGPVAGTAPAEKGSETASHVIIRIRDDGPGISPEERRHIFDPFFSARQAGRGLGLGLAKAWRIVTNHGGQIDVMGQPGHRTCFSISLPSLP
jgi:signal transduction histidine kinase